MSSNSVYNKSKMSAELEAAVTGWGLMIQESLDARFGKNKACFCLILASSGAGGSMHLQTNMKHEGLVPLFRELANKIAQGMKGIIIH